MEKEGRRKNCNCKLIALKKSKNEKSLVCTVHCTEVCFASFLSGGFTSLAVINPKERNLAKRTSVQCTEVRNALYFPVGVWQVPVDNLLGTQKIKNTTVYSITEEKIAALRKNGRFRFNI